MSESYSPQNNKNASNYRLLTLWATVAIFSCSCVGWRQNGGVVRWRNFALFLIMQIYFESIERCSCIMNELTSSTHRLLKASLNVLFSSFLSLIYLHELFDKIHHHYISRHLVHIKWLIKLESLPYFPCLAGNRSQDSMVLRW